MEFSRPEYWSGLPFPSPRDFPDPGIKSGSSALQADTLPPKPLGKHNDTIKDVKRKEVGFLPLTHILKIISNMMLRNKYSLDFLVLI